MSTVVVQKWGNSLGVRIPKAIAQQTKIKAGSEVEVSCAHGRVILQPLPIPSLKELLASIKPGQKPPVVDWGKPVGKEVW